MQQPEKSKWKNHLEISSFHNSHMIICYTDHMLYCSWDMVSNRCNCYFSFWAIFCPFNLLAAQKLKISKKWKRLEILSFYTSVPKIMIICYTVPEIWHMMYVIVIFHFGLFFWPFIPLTAQKIKISKKWKNTWRYHHFTQVYQKSYVTLFLRYGTWQMQLLLFILGYFLPFYCPLTAQKIKISEKWKKSLEISSFYTCVPKITIRWCTVPEIWCVTDRRTNGQTEKVTYRGGCPT